MPEVGGDPLDINKRLRVALVALAEISKVSKYDQAVWHTKRTTHVNGRGKLCNNGIPGFAAGQQQAKHSRRKGYSKFDDRRGPEYLYCLAAS